MAWSKGDEGLWESSMMLPSEECERSRTGASLRLLRICDTDVPASTSMLKSINEPVGGTVLGCGDEANRESGS